MEGNTWSEHCEMFHQILEERGEPLFLRIDVIDAFSFDVFLELRWCQFRHTAVLYHSTFGRRQIDSIEYRKFLEEYKRTGREMPTEEIANALPLWHFLRFQYVDENIFTAVKHSLQGTTQSNGLTGGVSPVRFYNNVQAVTCGGNGGNH